MTQTEQPEQWRQVWCEVAQLAQDHEDPRLNIAVSALHDTIQRAFTERTAELVAENAKLREALRKLTDAAGTAIHFKHQKTNAMLGLEIANRTARQALVQQDTTALESREAGHG